MVALDKRMARTGCRRAGLGEKAPKTMASLPDSTQDRNPDARPNTWRDSLRVAAEAVLLAVLFALLFGALAVLESVGRPTP